MNRWVCCGLILLACLYLGTTTITAQPNTTAVNPLQQARQDAIKRLVKIIKNFRISYYLTVNDIIKEHYQYENALMSFLASRCRLENSNYLPDGIYQVTMTITTAELIKGLEQIHRELGIKQSWPLRNIRSYYPYPIIRVTGKSHYRVSGNKLPTFWHSIPEQGRLMALRAAKVDAYRNMAEKIKGLRLNSTTTVRDFIAENDDIRSAFNHFIRSIHFVGNPRYKSDGIIEVTAEIRVSNLIAALANICQRYYYGPHWQPADFNNIATYCPFSSIRVVGSGVPPAIYRPHNRLAPFPFATRPYSLGRPPAWVGKILRVSGVGFAPPNVRSPARRKLMAQRAARLDAYRQLAQRIYGLSLNSDTRIRNLLTSRDNLAAQIQAFIRGARLVEVKERPNGEVVVVLELNLANLWKLVK